VGMGGITCAAGAIPPTNNNNRDNDYATTRDNKL